MAWLYILWRMWMGEGGFMEWGCEAGGGFRTEWGWSGFFLQCMGKGFMI